MPGQPSEVAAPAAASSWCRGGRGREGEAVLWSGEAVFWSGRVRVIQVVVQPDSSRHTYAWLALGGGCAGRGAPGAAARRSPTASGHAGGTFLPGQRPRMQRRSGRARSGSIPLGMGGRDRKSVV